MWNSNGFRHGEETGNLHEETTRLPFQRLWSYFSENRPGLFDFDPFVLLSLDYEHTDFVLAGFLKNFIRVLFKKVQEIRRVRKIMDVKRTYVYKDTGLNCDL